MKLILDLYRNIFCHPFLYKLNLHIYKISLRGLGILNSEGNNWTGEDYFLESFEDRNKVKVVLDVGSNTDAYGFNYFSKAKIYCFEPHPETFKKFENIWRSKKRVKGFHYAVSNKLGKVKLWDFAQDAELKNLQPTSQLSSVYKPIINNLHKQKSQSYEVKTITIDEFVKKQKISEIDLLKIDTEGHEYSVLQGAKKTLKENKIKVIQFEFNEMNVYSRTFMKDFIDLLSNYDLYRLLPNGKVSLKDYRPITHEIFGFQNIIGYLKK